MNTVRRMLLRMLVTVFAVAGLGVGSAGVAAAHDVLISSDPTDRSTVPTAPSSVVFTFDQPVQNFDPVVSLVGPDGRQYAVGTPSISGNVVTGTVGTGPPGAYTAAYRIVSADGHPVTGEIHFTVTGGASTLSPAATSGGATSGGATSGRAGSAPPAAPPTASAPAAPPTASAPAAPPTSADAGPEARNSLPPWLWAGLIIAALLVAAAAVILLRRPSSPAAADRDY